jgi:hypothetical protein
MVDYYTVMARAVAGLSNNTPDARQILYERARAALIATLTGQTPPVIEVDIERERLALEKSIQKVEDETLSNQARELQTPDTPTPLRNSAELAGPIEAQHTGRFPSSMPDVSQVESSSETTTSKSQRPLLKFRTLDINLLRLSCLMLLVLILLILVVGDISFVHRVLNYLILVSSAALILCVLGMLPIEWPRPIVALSMYLFLISSYLFGITVWLLGVVTAFQYWGWLGLWIGFCLGVVGVVPVGIMASALHSDWIMAVVTLAGVLSAYGARDLARERATERK